MVDASKEVDRRLCRRCYLHMNVEHVYKDPDFEIVGEMCSEVVKMAS
jgi:hypothetical protein